MEQHLDLAHSLVTQHPGRRGRRWRGLRLRFSERRRLLLLVDVLVVNVVLYFTLASAHGLVNTEDLQQGSIKWFVTLTVLWLGWALLLDVYSLPLATHAEQVVRAVGAAALLTALSYVLTPWLTPPLASRSLIFAFAGGLLIGLLAWRLLYVRIFGQPWFKQRALIVGAGPTGQALAQAIQSAPGTPSPYRAAGYELVGFVDNNPARWASAVAGLPVLGSWAELPAALQQLDVDEMIVTVDQDGDLTSGLFDLLLSCHAQGVCVTSGSAIYERLLGRVPVGQLGYALNDMFVLDDWVGSRLYAAAKRMGDVFLCLLLLAALVVVAPLVALANACWAPGPIFYSQQRVGRGGRCFRLYKLRSMRPDAEPPGRALWAQAADERVTPVGRWLRRTRLDELPQCLNVLRGEMSLIGPRPERPEFVGELVAAIPGYHVRHTVRPGITGWAQVNFRYASTVRDAVVKLEYDIFYVKHASLLLDLQILARTAATVVKMKGT